METLDTVRISLRFFRMPRALVHALAVILVAASAAAQEYTPYFYDTGSPAFTDIYVDPVNGNDSNSGATSAAALKTIDAAWRKIPQGVTLTTGYHILMLPGTFPESSLPNYWESRYGTQQAPIVFEPVSGQGSVTWAGDANIFDVRYLYFINFTIAPDPAGDTYHCEKCDHILLRGMTLNGMTFGQRAAQETVKVNQSQYVYIENSNIGGASDNAIDFVAVQYGHLVGNKVHDADDWCAYAKGGSAYLRVEGNEFYDCGTGGFTAGQGTGFEFMTSPWIHYEAYDLKFINNVVHDTEGAAIGVNGGYNILMAGNTFYRVGSRSHGIEVVFGLRSCDGNTAQCGANRSAGGWGIAQTGTEAVIPNRNVMILDNVLYNPAGFQSASQHLAIYAPRAAATNSNVPSPVKTDTNLVISGNVFWNGPPSLPIGVEDDQGCAPSNPTCSLSQLQAQNYFNSIEPQLINPEGADFRPVAGGNLFGLSGAALVNFSGGDRQSTPLAPEGNLANSLVNDRGGSVRPGVVPAGAYGSATSSPNPPTAPGVSGVPADPNPGGGGGGGGTTPGNPPVIGSISVRKVKVGKKLKFTVSANVTDDSRVESVIASISPRTGDSRTVVLARSGGKKSPELYSKSSTFPKGTKIARVEITATDDSGLQSVAVK